MRATVLVVTAMVFALALAAGEAVARQPNPAHAHIGHVMEGWRDTPDNQGFLPTAMAEARIAAQHAALAARDLENLNAMKQHAAHVLHAVDPAAAGSGPGRGYGVKRAAESIAAHIEMAAGAQGASQNVVTHAEHIATSARNTVARADRIVALVAEIQAAETAAAAAPLVQRLATLAEQLVEGAAPDGGDRVGWQEGQGGLRQVEQHMNLLMRGEGLSS